MIKTGIRTKVRQLKFQLLLPGIALLLFVVVALIVTVTNTYTETILEQENRRMRTAFRLTENAILRNIDMARIMTTAMMLDADVQSYLGKTPASDLERAVQRMNLIDKVKTTLAKQQTVYGIMVLYDEGKMFGVLPIQHFFAENNYGKLFSEEMLQKIMSVPLGESRWAGPVASKDIYRIPTDNINDNPPEHLMMCITSLRYSTDLRLITLIDPEVFSDYVNMLYDNQGSSYLVTGDGEVLTKTPGADQFPEAVIDKVRVADESQLIIENASGESSSVTYRHIKDLEWYLLRIMPMEQYERTAIELRNTVLQLAAIMLGVVVLVYLLWIRRISAMFQALRASIRRMRGGRLVAGKEDELRITEFENIRQEFNEMGVALQDMIDRTQEMKQTQLELELRSLQTQLSPHMIFNSITAIRWSAIMLGDDRVADMLVELSEMLRPIFRDWKIEWTLREELDHLSHYAKLLDLRYGKRFSLECDVSEEMHDIRVPRFTLQPLVENSCEHGGNNLGTIHVTIRGWCQDGQAHICVCDNGEGMSEEHIQRVRNSIQEGVSTGHIGIANVATRLRLCMGETSQLTLEQNPEGGLTVELYWPADPKDYQNQNTSYQI